MKARIAEAEKAPAILGECLMAWRRGEEGADAEAGAYVVAGFVLMVRNALKG